MLTLFTTTKPFRGHIEIIQNNAIKSWLSLSPRPEVIIFGNDEGAAEAAARFGIRHVPEVECNEYGTPIISHMFGIAQETAGHPLVCYINADIILLSDFPPAIGRMRIPSFLLVGRRWDVEVKEPLDFSSTDWEEKLRSRVAASGRLHGPTGIDYFAFPRGLYKDIPPMAIGRGGWDNWFIYKARALKAPVVDATGVITAVHQNHDYSHSLMRGGVWKGPERERNIKLMGGRDHDFTLNDATWLLTPQGLKPALTPVHLCRHMYSIPILHPRLYFLLLPFKACRRLARALLNKIRSSK
jgi:hypothetical protein